LKVLKLSHYAGSQFPRWLSDGMKLYNLVELSLNSCLNCTHMPSVSQLPCLEVLKMKHIKNLRYLCISNTADGESNHPPTVFPKLKFVSLKKMELLEMREQTDIREVSSVTLPLLDALEIIDCPKLKDFPHVPVLKSLTVVGNRTLVGLVRGITTLSRLSLSATDTSSEVLNTIMVDLWGSLTDFHLEGFNAPSPVLRDHKNDQPTKIEELFLGRCDLFIQSGNWFWPLFTNLKGLIISGCNSHILARKGISEFEFTIQLNIEECEKFTGLSPDLFSLEPYEGLRNLEDMQITSCPNLVAFPTYFPRLKFPILGSSVLETLPDMRCLLNLRRLELSQCEALSSLPEVIVALKYIFHCPKLEALPEGLQQRMHNLESFSINGSPSLERKCTRGVYWDRVKDVPELTLSDAITNVEQQHSAWQHVTRAISAGCRSAWYRVICELISAILLVSMVHLTLPPSSVLVHHSMLVFLFCLSRF
jgi:hypothetical protein